MFSICKLLLVFLLSIGVSNGKSIEDPPAENQLQKDSVKTPWLINFFAHGAPVKKHIPLIDVEIADNQHIIRAFKPSQSKLNSVLAEYYNNADFFGLLEVILLNHTRDEWIIHTGKNTYKTKEEEVFLSFESEQRKEYRVEIIPELNNYYFFYVEKSGGLDSIRDVRSRLDQIIESDKPFLAYFNNTVAKDSADIIQFYNELFTRITQPPFNHMELNRVMSHLQNFLPYLSEAINLHMYLYFSRSSYNNMKRGFIQPLVHRLRSEMGIHSMTVFILTDFDIHEMKEDYKYINITKQKNN